MYGTVSSDAPSRRSAPAPSRPVDSPARPASARESRSAPSCQWQLAYHQITNWSDLDSIEHVHSSLHRRARAAARVGPRLHRARADAPRPAVGAGRWFPNEVFAEDGRPGTAGAEVPRAIRRTGRRLPARGGARARSSHDRLRAGRRPGIGAHINIATPPIFKFGTEDQKQRYLVPAIAGEMIGALGITEPGAGSDVAALSTRAERVDGGCVVNGEKTYITNGVRADFIVTAVKTTPEGGHGGISFLIVERGEGVRVLGRCTSSAGTPRTPPRSPSHDVFVAEENLLGELNEGFRLIMANFQWERLAMALGAVGAMQIAWERTAEFARERQRLRQAAVGPSDDPPQARRHGHVRLHVPLRHLRRATALRRRRGTAEGGHDGQAADPARLLRADGRVPADPRRRRLHEASTGSSAPPATPASARSAAAATRSCARSSAACSRSERSLVGSPSG